MQIPCFIVCNLVLAEMISGQNANRVSYRLTTPRAGRCGEHLTEGSHKLLPAPDPRLPWPPASMPQLGLSRVWAHHRPDKKTPWRDHLDKLHFWVWVTYKACVILFSSYPLTWPWISAIAWKSPNTTLS